MTPNPLVGQIIQQILLTSDARAIKFVLADGQEIIARCEGDCCSSTWIEDVFNPEAALGKPVASAVDIELPEALRGSTKTSNDEEVVQYYGFAIKTARGCCTIAYRNSSNGYYGGGLCWPDDDYYEGAFGQNKSTEQWIAVKELTE